MTVCRRKRQAEQEAAAAKEKKKKSKKSKKTSQDYDSQEDEEQLVGDSRRGETDSEDGAGDYQDQDEGGYSDDGRKSNGKSNKKAASKYDDY